MKVRRALLFVGLTAALMMPEIALAQAGAPGLNTLQRILNAMTGPYARVIAGIAAALVGYGCLSGRIDWEPIKSYVLGAVFIFGAVNIAEMVSGG